MLVVVKKATLFYIQDRSTKAYFHFGYLHREMADAACERLNEQGVPQSPVDFRSNFTKKLPASISERVPTNG